MSETEPLLLSLPHIEIGSLTYWSWTKELDRLLVEFLNKTCDTFPVLSLPDLYLANYSPYDVLLICKLLVAIAPKSLGEVSRTACS